MCLPPGFSHLNSHSEYRLLLSLGLSWHIAVAHPNEKKSSIDCMVFLESRVVNIALSKV